MYRTVNSKFVHEEQTHVKKTLTVKKNKSDPTLHPRFARGDGWLLL